MINGRHCSVNVYLSTGIHVKTERSYFITVNFLSKLLGITNGKLEDVLQMRKLTEDEQQTIKMAKQNMDKQMADTMNEQLRVQQEIQQQINDDMQEMYT